MVNYTQQLPGKRWHVQDMQTVSEADAAALEGISRATGGLWQVLSQCVARIETGLQAAAPEASPAGQPGSRMLPTGAAQMPDPALT